MDFNFEQEAYKEPVRVPYMSTSGYVGGEIVRCEYVASCEAVDVNIIGEKERFDNRFFLTNKDGSFSDGYYQFMAMCKILGLTKVEKNDQDRYADIEGKKIALGVQFVFTASEQYPKKYVQSVHDFTTGKTYTEMVGNLEATAIRTPIKDRFKGVAETTVKQDFAPADEPPAGFGNNVPADDDLPF